MGYYYYVYVFSTDFPAILDGEFTSVYVNRYTYKTFTNRINVSNADLKMRSVSYFMHNGTVSEKTGKFDLHWTDRNRN
jgi:hypothetical protein